MVKKNFSEGTYEVGSDEHRNKPAENNSEWHGKDKVWGEKKKNQTLVWRELRPGKEKQKKSANIWSYQTLKTHKTSKNLYSIPRAMESNLIRKMTWSNLWKSTVVIKWSGD